MKVYERILVLSDMHLPYGHKDNLRYLTAIKKKYKPDKIICIGDELDYHAMSFHDNDPDLDSAGKELEKGIAQLQGIMSLFPEVSVVESNHGSMKYRKAKHHGIPRHLMKSYKDVLSAPQGWNWYKEVVLKMSNGQKVCFRHQLGANVRAASQSLGMSFVQGHFHTKCEIQFWSSTLGVCHFGMTVGCAIDDDSMAYAYNKLFKDRPIINHSMIINGIPRLMPMPMTKSGRWNGDVP